MDSPSQKDAAHSNREVHDLRRQVSLLQAQVTEDDDLCLHFRLLVAFALVTPLVTPTPPPPQVDELQRTQLLNLRSAKIQNQLRGADSHEAGRRRAAEEVADARAETEELRKASASNGP